MSLAIDPTTNHPLCQKKRDFSQATMNERHGIMFSSFSLTYKGL